MSIRCPYQVEMHKDKLKKSGIDTSEVDACWLVSGTLYYTKNGITYKVDKKHYDPGGKGLVSWFKEKFRNKK